MGQVCGLHETMSLGGFHPGRNNAINMARFTSGKKIFASTASVCTRRSRRSGRHLATMDDTRQGTVRPDAARQGTVCPDTSRQGTVHPDAVRQGTVRPDAARHGDCVWTRSVRAPCIWTQLSGHHCSGRSCHGTTPLDAAVRAPLLRTQLSRQHLSRCNFHGNVRTYTARQGTSRPDEECQGKWDPDEAYDGAHIGNRAVTVLAFRRDSQGTVHCSEDY